MKILFCGTMVPDKIEYRFKDISAAGNRFQNNMIKNLEELGHEVVSVSYVAAVLAEEEKQALQNANNRIYVFREAANVKDTFRAVHECRKIVESLIETADCIMCYNVFYSFWFLPQMAKRKAKKSFLILADYSGPECFRSIKRKIYARIQENMIRRFDTVIGLSVHTKTRLKERQKFVLMEGGIDEEFYNSFYYQEKMPGEPLTFMYAGLLSGVTGIDLLLNAMKRNKNPDIRLVITGKGELEALVMKAAREDSRILYQGHLAYEEYIKSLQAADILINPRNMKLPENRNNFPSKIMDYLATGKRIVSTKFAGWEKFAEYITFVDMEELDKALEETLQSRQEFERNRRKAYEFLWKKLIEEKILAG